MLKSRKKMLLSSIAMLLVALIALGTATFAWYSNVTTVKADQTQFNATAASGLVIRHQNDSYSGADAAAQKAWKTALNATNGNQLLTASDLSPAALSFGNWSNVFGATGTSNDPDNYALYGSLTGIENANLATDGHFLVDQMYVAGESATMSVDFDIKGTSSADTYLNVAVYVGNDLVKVYTTDDATKTTQVTGSSSSPTKGTDDAYDIVPFTGNWQTVTTEISCPAKTASPAGEVIHIIAYVDGFNHNCTTNSVDTSTASVNYRFYVHGTTPA